MMADHSWCQTVAECADQRVAPLACPFILPAHTTHLEDICCKTIKDACRRLQKAQRDPFDSVPCHMLANAQTKISMHIPFCPIPTQCKHPHSCGICSSHTPYPYYVTKQSSPWRAQTGFSRTSLDTQDTCYCHHQDAHRRCA